MKKLIAILLLTMLSGCALQSTKVNNTLDCGNNQWKHGNICQYNT